MSSSSIGNADAAEQHVFQSWKGSRGNLNTKFFHNTFEASLNETIVTFPEDLMDSGSPIAVIQQRAVLKNLSKNFQREVKATKDEEGLFVSQLCRNRQHLREMAKEIVLVYCAALHHYFYTRVPSRAIQDARWKLFFSQHILVFHNHLFECGEEI